jgi:hypothetical protein
MRSTLIQRNQPDAIAAWTPYAGQVILPQVGHFGLLSDYNLFNSLVSHFVNQGFDGQLPYY